MNKYKITLLTILISGCSSAPIQTQMEEGFKGIKAVAVVNVMFGPFDQPTFPLVDAMSINRGTEAVAPRVLPVITANLDKYRDEIAKQLNSQLGFSVNYGKAFVGSPEYAALKKALQAQSLQTASSVFPAILTATGEENFFSFRRGAVLDLFDDPANISEVAGKICEMARVDAIVVSYSWISISNPLSMSQSAQFRLESHLLLIDRTGKIVARGRFKTLPVFEKAGEVESYQRTVELFPSWIAQLISKMKNPGN